MKRRTEGNVKAYDTIRHNMTCATGRACEKWVSSSGKGTHAARSATDEGAVARAWVPEPQAIGMINQRPAQGYSPPSE